MISLVLLVLGGNQLIIGLFSKFSEKLILENHELNALQELKGALGKILIYDNQDLIDQEENEYVVQFLNAGGIGYMLKNSKKEEFKDAIKAVLRNQRYLSYELSHNLLNSVIAKGSDPEGKKSVHLTRREIEIIKKIAEEKNNQEIADELNISLRTVETHRRNIMQKLEAKSMISLLKYASQQKLIDL
jgi:DNA-binding NarL/FixJ family response regulator